MAQLQNTTVNGTLSATTFSGPGGSLTNIPASAFTSGQLSKTLAPSGTVVKFTEYVNNTRIVAPSSSDYTAFSFSVTKDYASTKWVIKGHIPGHGNDNDGNYMFIGIDGSRDFTGIGDMTANSQGHGIVFLQTRTGISAGSHTITFGWQPIDGSANRPTNIINQNNSDDGRNRQQGSVFHIWEIQA
jgi:hypothetical protein